MFYILILGVAIVGGLICIILIKLDIIPSYSNWLMAVIVLGVGSAIFIVPFALQGEHVYLDLATKRVKALSLIDGIHNTRNQIKLIVTNNDNIIVPANVMSNQSFINYINNVNLEIANYNSQLKEAKIKRTYWFYIWFGDGFFVPSKVMELKYINNIEKYE